MTSCPQTVSAPFVCPTLEQTAVALCANLPRGAAWPVNDGGGTIARFLAWLQALNGSVPAISEWLPGYVQAGFYVALAAVKNAVEADICALKEEFFCATASKTLDLWNEEYGLPDPCDPGADLCTRVSAVGGSQPSYFESVAAQAGWSVMIANDAGFCGSQAGSVFAGGFTAGGGEVSLGLTITVSLENSPAFAGGAEAIQPLAGLLLAGMTLNCPPSIGALQCLLERILPAHVPATYVTI